MSYRACTRFLTGVPGAQENTWSFGFIIEKKYASLGQQLPRTRLYVEAGLCLRL